MDYDCQLYNTASVGRLKKLDNIHREGMIIYTGAFKLHHVEAPTLETKKEWTGVKIPV